MVKLGTAGTADSFKTMGYKNYKQIPTYLNQFGLDCFEYQCGHGIRIKEETARDLGAVFAQGGIGLSLHAPYYISMSSVEKAKRNNSVKYIVDSARIADYMGATKVVIHTGSCGKISREQGMLYVKETMGLALKALEEEGLSHIILCPETMGKVNQLGDLQEVVELCKVHESLLPCIDFGHLNARSFGGIQTKEDYAHILDTLHNGLGSHRGAHFHAHFARIEYTAQGGEKKHVTFADTQYGPDYQPLMELIYEKNLSPTIICESAGTQAEDAQTMKTFYQQLERK